MPQWRFGAPNVGRNKVVLPDEYVPTIGEEDKWAYAGDNYECPQVARRSDVRGISGRDEHPRRNYNNTRLNPKRYFVRGRDSQSGRVSYREVSSYLVVCFDVVWRREPKESRFMSRWYSGVQLCFSSRLECCICSTRRENRFWISFIWHLSEAVLVNREVCVNTASLSNRWHCASCNGNGLK